MSHFFDPTGRSTYGIGICDRCKMVFSIEDLYSDPNSPGLKVCLKDRDQFDPWRLPARQTERINLPFVRPDLPLDGYQAPFEIIHILGAGGTDYLVTEDSDPILVVP